MAKFRAPLFAILVGLLIGGCRHNALRVDTRAMAP